MSTSVQRRRSSGSGVDGPVDSCGVKGPDQSGDLVVVVFDGEVAGVEEVQLGVGHIAHEGLAALGREDGVMCAPHDKGRWLVTSQVLVPGGVLLGIGAVVVEEIEVDSPRVRSRQDGEVEVPVVGADAVGIAGAFGVDPFDAVRLEEGVERLLGLGCAVVPEGVAGVGPRRR